METFQALKVIMFIYVIDWYLRTSAQASTTFCGSTTLFGGFQNFDNTYFIAKMFVSHHTIRLQLNFPFGGNNI